MELTIRNEAQCDYRVVEELTREAFWNIYIPGCNEHFVLHKLRESEDFIPELDFVAVMDGNIVGNIVYSYAKITKPSGEEHTTISFGPISVLPQYQKQGIGSALIHRSLDAAKTKGFDSVLIYGDPRYYGRFGFRCAERFDIRTRDGKFAFALLALELTKGALGNTVGNFSETSAFEYDEKEFAVYESGFPQKEKEVTPSQAEFQVLAGLRY